MKRPSQFAFAGVALAAMILFGVYNTLAGDEPAAAFNPNTHSLLVERAKTVAEFGKEHPRVKALDAQILVAARLPVEAAVLDVAKIADAEVRMIVQNLVGRIDSLERRVAELEARKPRTELLGR
ncbi:hypothetical protein [Rhodopirellula bahusiensis]|nr:hypothetical protein [Rhodopirellula bahusiensis]